MATNYKGRDYKLYLSASAPATASISTSYTLVGDLVSVAISESRNAIETSSKDSGDSSAFIGGRRNITLSGSARFDHTADTGQQIFKTVMESASGLVYFLVSSNTATDEEWYGSGILTQYDVTFPDDDASGLDFTIQITGSITQANGQSTT